MTYFRNRTCRSIHGDPAPSLAAQDKAAARGAALDAAPLPACARYTQFLRTCGTQPLAVHAATFWAVERAYCQAWRSHRPMAAPYDEFAARWGSDEFAAYVEALEALADGLLAGASEGELEEARVAVAKVAELEVDFWEMAVAAERAA